MVSTFMGLETSKRALSVAQSALYTIGHNVANANTPGYSRQRVNLTPTDGFPTPGMNSPRIPGQLGTGVEAGSVQRIRDSFLDAQYRSQNSKIGYYSSLSESLTKMEEILNDPSESGLLNTMNTFWNSLEDLTTNTDNAGARAVVASSGQMVAETLNYYYNSLTSVQEDIRYQIGVEESGINTIISNIQRINEDISKVEPHGFIPNDLYDERDVLVDQLSQLVNVKVSAVFPDKYGIADKAVASGLYNVELIQEDGSSYMPPINLISVNHTGIVGTEKIEVQTDKATGAVSGVKIGDTTLYEYKFSGTLAGVIESAGYVNKNANGQLLDAKNQVITDPDAPAVVLGKYPDMLQKLNNMTEAFVNEFNRVHSQGYVLGDTPTKGGNFFEITPGKNAAETIKVNADIIKDPSKIAAGGKSGASGDNENAHNLAVIKSKDFKDYEDDDSTKASSLSSKGLTGTFDAYYAGIIGNLGVDSASAQKDYSNATILATSVDKNRQSVSAVSLDEEMTDMIKFQQAYNASARMVTLVDEMLDKIINGMGTVGR
ncbi:flagellar hook-associated protein FlgK [Peribacillus asahii]|uniref:flagellar hook-associated protein FlgK n=1 Tax=Peribacillus asahii TaxID=228899 RepID=UPI0038157868